MSTSASYDPASTDDKDWVRRLIGDTDTDAAKLQDEEICALVTEESADAGAGAWVKYLAAARALEMVVLRWKLQGNDVVEKRVGELAVRKASGQDAYTAIGQAVVNLRSRAAELQLSRPRAFRVLGTRC